MGQSTSIGCAPSQKKSIELRESLPRSIDPRLKHYLDRKSYDKALEYLEGTSV